MSELLPEWHHHRAARARLRGGQHRRGYLPARREPEADDVQLVCDRLIPVQAVLRLLHGEAFRGGLRTVLVHFSVNGKVFVATNQLQFRKAFSDRYGKKVLTYSQELSDSTAANFFSGSGAKLKGKEVLVDCLLLSKCHRLLKCTSAVGEFALYFSSTIESCKDMNYCATLENAEAVKVFRRYGLKHPGCLARLRMQVGMLCHEWMGKGLLSFSQAVERYSRFEHNFLPS